MATRIIPLDLENEDVREEFEAQQRLYWNGHCISFAAAAHRITGWEMIAIDGQDLPLAHCGVRAPDGTIWDGRGRVTPDQFELTHANATPEHFRVVTWDEMRTAWPPIDLPGTERLVSRMYPELPHLPTSDRSRTVAFMDDVEAISRRHNAWIVATPNAMHSWPVIGDEFEEIVGYRVAHNHGITTLDRVLRSEVTRGPTHTPRRIERFVDELASISREHKLWIRAGLPTTWPRIDQLDDVDVRSAHYVIRQSDNGGGFLVNIAP